MLTKKAFCSPKNRITAKWKSSAHSVILPTIGPNIGTSATTPAKNTNPITSDIDGKIIKFAATAISDTEPKTNNEIGAHINVAETVIKIKLATFGGFSCP